MTYYSNGKILIIERSDKKVKKKTGYVYVGVYKDRRYCISDCKYAIIAYLQYHRGLKRNEYEILYEAIEAQENLDWYYLELFLGEYYLPRIDISTIERDCESNTLIDDTIQLLEEIEYELKISKLEREREKIDEALSMLENLNEKKLEKLEYGARKHHPLMYAPMDEYLDMLGDIRYRLAMEVEFKRKMDKED